MNDNRLSRRSVLRGLGGVTAASAIYPVFVSFDAKAAESIKLTLPWLPEGEVAFMYAARKQGFWKDRGLDVSISRGFGSSNASKTVGLGRYDFGQADIAAMLKGASAGLPLVSIGMVNQRSPICIVTLEDSGIRAPKDLEGHKLGGSPGGGSRNLWPAFAKANNIDTSKVNITNLQPGLNIQALINKDVDAVGTFYQSSAPYLWADKVPFRIIFFAQNGLNIYSLTFITQRDRVEKSTQQVKGFIEGVMEGLKFSYLNPDQTLEDFVEAVPESGKTARDREITKHSLLINTALGMADEVVENGLGWHSPDKVKYTLDTVDSFLNFKQKPSIGDIYTNDFVGNVKLTADEWKRVRESAKRYLFA